MTEENTNNQATTTGDDGQAGGTTPAGEFESIRPAELKALKRQLLEEREARQTLENAQLKAQEERERKQLEERGEYETAKKTFEQQLEEIKAARSEDAKAHSKEKLQWKLRDALRSAEANDDYFIRGVVDDYDGEEDGIAAYIETLKASEANARYFGFEGSAPVTQTPPGTARPSVRSKSLEDRLAEGDPAAQREAFSKLFGT
jgi:hypothetical protein